jgi:hypothetical protein
VTAQDDSGQGRPRYSVLNAVLDLVAPIATYYALHAFGVHDYLALLLSAVIPGVNTLVQFARQRRIDSFGLFVMSMIVLSTAASLLTGSTRFLLAKDGWFTAVTGVWFFVSMFAGRPLSYVCARPLLEGRVGPKDVLWETLWERLPRFRRAWRVINVIWGVATLADAVVRVVMAYTLPVDLVPALGGAQYLVLFLVLQVVTTVVNLRVGMYDARSPLYAPVRDAPPVPGRATPETAA